MIIGGLYMRIDPQNLHELLSFILFVKALDFNMTDLFLTIIY